MCLVIFTIRHTFFLHAFDSITNNRSTHIIIFRIKCAIFWHCSERNRIKCTGKKLCNYNARMTIEICHFSRVPFHWLRAFDAPSSKQIEPTSSWWGRRIAEQRGKIDLFWDLQPEIVIIIIQNVFACSCMRSMRTTNGEMPLYGCNAKSLIAFRRHHTSHSVKYFAKCNFAQPYFLLWLPPTNAIHHQQLHLERRGQCVPPLGVCGRGMCSESCV